MIESERVTPLNDKPIASGTYVLYWMQAAQRVAFNHALEYGAEQANALGEPLVVVFGLTDRFPEANARHYIFMLEGLREVQGDLERRGIRMVVLRRAPDRAALHLAKEASLLVVDAGYLRIQRAWRDTVSRRAPCRVVQVESEVVVPVGLAYVKEAYSAGILRPKIQRFVEAFIVPVRQRPLEKDALSLTFDGGLDLSAIPALLRRMKIDHSVSPSPFYQGGASQAGKLLKAFRRAKLDRYATDRNDPSLGNLSHLSPYLHFGQISALEVALTARDATDCDAESRASFLEELIVRRELSMNFCYYNENYDSYAALPAWALTTLELHQRDPREYVYTREEFEMAETHDPYWNAAQREMMITGKMHGYMRMYWGKKILEWSMQPEEAFETALYLNNKYELDGRDPNGFAGVAWCFGKHDRAWNERPVFGKVRSMTASGLRRKFDIEAYVHKIDGLRSRYGEGV